MKKAKLKPGRPRKSSKPGPKTNWKLTEETIQKFEMAFGVGATIREACYFADISESRYYDWVKKFPELSEKFDRLKERPVFLARQTVIDAIDPKSKNRDPKIAIDYLKSKMYKEFANRTDLTTDDKSINPIDLTKLTNEELAQFEKLADKASN